MQTRIARMIHHRDLAGDYEWIAVDCDKKGAPTPVFVKPEWPNTRDLGTLGAEAAQGALDYRRAKIIAASGLGDTDDITKLVTKDLETAKRRTRQVRGAPHLWPPLANALGRQHRAPR